MHPLILLPPHSPPPAFKTLKPEPVAGTGAPGGGRLREESSPHPTPSAGPPTLSCPSCKGRPPTRARAGGSAPPAPGSPRPAQGPRAPRSARLQRFRFCSGLSRGHRAGQGALPSAGPSAPPAPRCLPSPHWLRGGCPARVGSAGGRNPPAGVRAPPAPTEHLPKVRSLTSRALGCHPPP